jgi:hypothetical protein
VESAPPPVACSAAVRDVLASTHGPADERGRRATALGGSPPPGSDSGDRPRAVREERHITYQANAAGQRCHGTRAAQHVAPPGAGQGRARVVLIGHASRSTLTRMRLQCAMPEMGSIASGPSSARILALTPVVVDVDREAALGRADATEGGGVVRHDGYARARAIFRARLRSARSRLR